MTLDVKRTRDCLQALDFKKLFNELGWSLPKNPNPLKGVIQNTSYTQQEIAELAGVVVLEIQMQDGKIPDATTRKLLHHEVSLVYRENLLIFLDASPHTQSLWYWVKHETDSTKSYPKEHLYVKGQPGDLSLGKLGTMVCDAADVDKTGKISVIEVANRLQKALDVEKVTKRFFEDFKEKHKEFLEEIDGIDDERDRRWYASVLLNRLMFIYFLQRKMFLDNGELDYLQVKLAESSERGTDLYYSEFLNLLFFEGFAKPEEERSAKAKTLLGKIVYLNGGLFLPHPVEKRCPNIRIPDIAFRRIFKLFSEYSWNLDDTPGGNDNEISPHVLGYIFEKYINQKSFGAYYTRPEITEYLCEQTIHTLILEKINITAAPGILKGRHFDTMEELLMNLDARLCRDLLDALPKISILDPACGSGAFLVSAMNTLMKVYGAITGKIEYLYDSYLTSWLQQARTEHGSLNYFIKKKIITENLFGVDIMEEATEIAKLRLFLALVSSVQSVAQLEPLPNIDFNILQGNSLIGLLKVNEELFNQKIKQLNLFQKSYQTVVNEKNLLIQEYRETSKYTRDLRDLRDKIQTLRDDDAIDLNNLLLDEFTLLGVKYEQATWDNAKQLEGKAKKRALTAKDIAALTPFHWGYEFDRVMNEQGGFDIIITNPPWEILKPQDKEFFATHSKLVSKNKMRIEDFETERSKLLQDAEIRAAWLEYQNRFPYQSLYFRNSGQYKNQIATVNGKKSGTDINLYNLFTEQCYNLLKPGGQCGIVIPSGIYTDLGAKQLREMLFGETQITGLFGFENRRMIFEGVDSRFKFVVLTFEKGGQTETFPAAFMRHDVTELERFPRYGALPLEVELIKQIAPDSFSIMEFKNTTDVRIAQKMQKFPLLGEKIENTWKLVLSREFDMTNNSSLFKTEQGPDCLPLYEGKMIHQFTHTWKNTLPRYWVRETEGRATLLGRKADTGQKLSYQDYRLGFRDIARNTDKRTLISTIIPPTFHGNKVPTVKPFDDCGDVLITNQQQLFLCAVWNSFTVDWLLRQKVTTTINFFYIYQLPIPRLEDQDIIFRMLIERAAKLICTTPEFQKLWETVMPNILWSRDIVAREEEKRNVLRAEIDGLIAHLYELTAKEFSYILSTFPLVEEAQKKATLEAYNTFSAKPEELLLFDLIQKGEDNTVEFKVAACWNAWQGRKDETMKSNIVEETAAFLNSRDGGTVLIGVEDDGTVVGLEHDYRVANPNKSNRDGYQLFLADALKSSLLGNWSLFYTISFGTVKGKEICKIDVAPAPEPVYLKNGDFHIRDGNRKCKLNAHEADVYRRNRW